MAKNIKRHVTHLKSKVVESNAPKLPTASDLLEGEIAVNYAKGYETLSIKNESGETVTFLPRPYNSARGGETLHPIFDGTGTAGGTNLSAAWSGNSNDIKTLYDGLTVLYKIPTAGHSSGDTLSINGGEAHKVLLNYNSVLTTHYPVGSIIKLIYDSTQSASFYTGSTTQKTTTGVWKIENYDSNETNIYYTRIYSTAYTASEAIYRYLICLKNSETTYLPVTSTSNTTANTKTITTSEFDPFGQILYYNATATTSSGSAITSGVLNDAYPLDLRYSFNVANVLTLKKDVYLVATPQSNGMAKLRNPSTSGVTSGPISQTLPTTDDGYIYIYLGYAYSTTSIYLTRNHPIYIFKNGKLRQYTGAGTASYYDDGRYVNTGRSVSTASGLTGGGNLSADRTLGLAAVTVGNYTGSGVTSNTVSYDSYGRVSSAAPIIYSAVTISANQTNVTCPTAITGTSKSGAQAVVIYKNNGTSTVWTVTVSNSAGYITPDGNQLTLYCRKGGYTEINYLNIGGTIYVRGV